VDAAQSERLRTTFDAGEWPGSFQQRRKSNRDMLPTTNIDIAQDEKADVCASKSRRNAAVTAEWPLSICQQFSPRGKQWNCRAHCIAH
jgi:hypothetical protein